MSQIGEKVNVAKPPIPAELTVKVIDACSGKAIKDANVSVSSISKISDVAGIAVFTKLESGSTDVSVKYHATEADYSTFIIHYPKFMRSHKAIAKAEDFVAVKEGKKSNIEIKLETHKVINDVIFHRKHIDFGGEDKYGHWWSVFAANMSFGWWPKYPVGSAENRRSEPPEPPVPLAADAGWRQKIQHKFSTLVYEASIKIYETKESGPGQTFRGVDGDLNGIYFGGIAKNGIYIDPHHLQNDQGDEQYSPVITICYKIDQIRNSALDFALAYKGDWSWRLEAGNHCHTFQKKLMKHLEFDKYKVIK